MQLMSNPPPLLSQLVKCLAKLFVPVGLHVSRVLVAYLVSSRSVEIEFSIWPSTAILHKSVPSPLLFIMVFNWSRLNVKGCVGVVFRDVLFICNHIILCVQVLAVPPSVQYPELD